MVVLKFVKVFLALVDAGEQPRIFLFLFRGGGQQISHVALHHFYQLFGDRSGVVHAWAHVDLYDPGIQVFIDHKVIPDHLKKSLLSSHRALTALDAPHNDALHLVLDHLPLLRPDKLHKGLHLPHALFDHRILVVLLDGVIGQVHEFIVDVVKRVVVAAEAEVALLVEPNSGWVEVLNEHPLPYVELAAVYQQRVFDVFLDDELDVLAEAVIGDVVQVVQALDASASGKDLIRQNVQFGLAIQTFLNPLISS